MVPEKEKLLSFFPPMPLFAPTPIVTVPRESSSVVYPIRSILGFNPSVNCAILSLSPCVASKTLQVLGAEKALFRTIKTGARPPKHGIIFQYAAIHQSPKWLRGKIARAVAGKLASAERMDVDGGGDKGQALKEALEKKIVDLKGRYQSPPHKREYGKTWRPPAQDVRRDVLGGPRGQREIGHPQPGSRDNRLRGRYRKDRR